MKIALDVGHNCYPDVGAFGIKPEGELNALVGTRVKNFLQSAKHEVISVNPFKAPSVQKSLESRVAAANIAKADFYLSIHHNALSGLAYGTEVYIGSEKGRPIASKILTNIGALGFYKRGVKIGNQFYVLKHTTMPAILVECCFCDSQRDINLWDAEKIGKAIANGFI